jgi:hypothetical protein
MGLLGKYFKMQMKLYLYCITFAESEILHFFKLEHYINKDETYIRYAQANDKEKSERRKERERMVEGKI